MKLGTKDRTDQEELEVREKERETETEKRGGEDMEYIKKQKQWCNN